MVKKAAPSPRESFLEMRDRIVARYPLLSPQLQAIAQFALNKPEIVAVETVVQLAKRNGVHASSLIRFAQAMGYSGFLEMKRCFSAHLVYLAKAQDQKLPAQPADVHVMRSHVSAGYQELDALDRGLDIEAFDRATNLLLGVEVIYVAAQHQSYPIGSLFAWTLLEAGRQCLMLDNVGGYALRQSQLSGPRDATVTISFSPYAPSVVQEAQAQRERGGTVIALTDTPLSPLAPHASELIIVPGMSPGPPNSMIGATLVVRALATAVAQGQGRKRATKKQIVATGKTTRPIAQGRG
jgi:DNA-binding MurR/RpiR family transcriptional regulator